MSGIFARMREPLSFTPTPKSSFRPKRPKGAQWRNLRFPPSPRQQLLNHRPPLITQLPHKTRPPRPANPLTPPPPAPLLAGPDTHAPTPHHGSHPLEL